MAIHSGKCIVSYGNPSGCMTTSSFFWVTIYLHAYYEVGVEQRRMSVFCTEYIIKMAASAALLCFFIFLGFSRVYLGASSLNQAVFGFTIGVVLAFIGHFKVKSMFLNMPEYYYSNIGGSAFKVGCKSYLGILFFCLLIPFGLAYGIFFLKYHVSEADQ